MSGGIWDIRDYFPRSKYRGSASSDVTQLLQSLLLLLLNQDAAFSSLQSAGFPLYKTKRNRRCRKRFIDVICQYGMIVKAFSEFLLCFVALKG